MTATTKPRPLAWLCELMQEDGSVRQQIVTENPDGIRWNDSGEPSPFKVTPLYAAIDAQAPPTVTGGSPEHLLQDHDRGLSQWLASKPDARLRVREACADIAAQAPQAAPVGAPTPTWQVAELVRDAWDIEEALHSFGADPTGDNGTAVVLAVLNYARATPPEQAAKPSPEQIAAARRALIAETLSDEPCVIGAGCATPPEQAAPVALTDEQIKRHGMPASECPPNSQVMLVSSIRRLLGIGAAAQGGEHG